jgi:uncharacterized protein YqhQ
VNEKPTNVGGQAVIEGVMMRSPRAMAVAVRRPSGELVVRDEPWNPIWSRSGLMKVPVARGALVLVESVMNGYAALGFAAEEAERAGGAGPPGARGASLLGAALRLPALVAAGASGDGAGPRDGARGERAGALALSIVLALGLFVGLPHLLAWLVGWLTGGHWDVDSFAFHALDGVFKLGIFVGYISLIAQIPEIRRVFEYHGAEHKAVNTFERGRPLALDEVRLQGTFHARCGTSFILFVLVLSILVFSVVFPLIPPVSESPLLNHLAMIAIKVPLMVPLAGLAYEVNRWAARHPGTAGVGLLTAPGRWMQKLTTREPDDTQLEVALAALKVCLEREAGAGPKAVTVEVYADLGELEARLAAPAA